MKSIFIFFVAFGVTVFGDLTSFEWQGDTLFDETNTQVSEGNPVADFVALTLFSDLTGFITGSNEIDISHINGANFHPFISPLDVAGPTPPPIAGDYATDFFNGDGTYATQTAYLLIHKGNGNIQVGDFIGFGTNSHIVNELDPDGPGGDPALTQQLFDGGIIVTNIQVIPEPTTLIALLAGIVGLVGFRRHLQKK